MRRLLAAAVLAGLMAASLACANVKPYQREALSKEKMQLDSDAEAALLEEHVYQYREGSAGGFGGGGGGCGCN